VEPLQIPQSHLAYLEGPVFASLAKTGRCSWPWPTLWRPDQPREAPKPGEICLALDESQADYFLEFDTPRDMNAILDASRFVYYLESTGELALAREGSLRDVVAMRCHDATGVLSERACVPTDGSDHFGNCYTDAARDAWQAEGRLFGQLAVCGCGEPGCGATYAWLEGERCRLLVEISAAGIARIEIGPFAAVRRR